LRQGRGEKDYSSFNQVKKQIFFIGLYSYPTDKDVSLAEVGVVCPQL
jgi:hypothetical protein